jgi:hypothetical protein
VVATNRASWNIAAAIAHDDKTGLITKPEVTDLIENYKNRLNIGWNSIFKFHWKLVPANRPVWLVFYRFFVSPQKKKNNYSIRRKEN